MLAPPNVKLTCSVQPLRLASNSGTTGLEFEASAVWLAAWARGQHALKQAACDMRGDFAIVLQCHTTGRAFLAVDRFAVQTLC